MAEGDQDMRWYLTPIRYVPQQGVHKDTTTFVLVLVLHLLFIAAGITLFWN
jgi:hypothetical protein